MITKQSFINMYSSKEKIIIYNFNHFSLLSVSPFKYVMKNMIEYEGAFHCNLFQLANQFSNTKKIKFTCKGIQSNNHNLQIYPFNNTILTSNSLQELSFVSNNTFDQPTVANELFNSIFFFPNLKSLDLTFFIFRNVNNAFNISNISQLKQLETLRLRLCEYIHRINTQMIDIVRQLPSLRILDIEGLLRLDEFTNELSYLGRLCAQPGAPPSLKSIHSFGDNIHNSQQVGCANLLKQLPALDEIDYEISGINDASFPISLAKWITRIKIRQFQFLDDHISILTHFFRLDSIQLISCSITEVMLQQLIHTHASRLKQITLSSCSHEVPLCIVSFATIAQCKELNSLCIIYCDGLLASEFELLWKYCKKLEFIDIFGCELNLSSEQQTALQIPSTTFPSLKKCFIKG
jgi:hypothetical protein